MAKKKKKKHSHGKRRGIIGGWYDKTGKRTSAPKRGKKGKRKHGGGAHRQFSKCGRCGRTIFGGPKGMATHRRKRHRGK